VLKYLPTNLSRPEIEGELSVSVNTVSTHLRSICMAFTALDALREGYEVYLVVDAIGGTSPEAHRVGLTA